MKLVGKNNKRNQYVAMFAYTLLCIQSKKQSSIHMCLLMGIFYTLSTDPMKCAIVLSVQGRTLSKAVREERFELVGGCINLTKHITKRLNYFKWACIFEAIFRHNFVIRVYLHCHLYLLMCQKYKSITVHLK